MTIDQIRHFLAVADRKSFSAAAEDLYISQSSISKSIIALEHELGSPLFIRAKKSTTLTEMGTVLYVDALHLSDGYDRFMRHAKRFTTEFRDSIHIIALPIMAQYGLFDLFHIFEIKHPDIRLIVEEPNDIELFQMMQKDTADFTVTRREGISADEYDWVQIIEDELALFVNAANPIAAATEIPVRQLRGEKLLLMKPGLPLHTLAMTACREAGFEPRVINTARIETLINHVQNNTGSALLAKRIEHVYHLPGIRIVRLHPPVISRVVLAWKKRGSLSSAKQMFADFIRDFIADITRPGLPDMEGMRWSDIARALGIL